MATSHAALSAAGLSLPKSRPAAGAARPAAFSTPRRVWPQAWHACARCTGEAGKKRGVLPACISSFLSTKAVQPPQRAPPQPLGVPDTHTRSCVPPTCDCDPSPLTPRPPHLPCPQVGHASAHSPRAERPQPPRGVRRRAAAAHVRAHWAAGLAVCAARESGAGECESDSPLASHPAQPRAGF